MRSKQLSRWQKILSWTEQRPVATAAIIIFVIAIGLGVVIGLGYWFNLPWVGVTRKTLWDWLQLLAVLAIPLVGALGTLWFTKKFNEQQSRTEREVALDNQHEAALQAYIDKMSELLLHEKLRKSSEDDDEVRVVAWVRTMSILPVICRIKNAACRIMCRAAKRLQQIASAT